MKKGVKLKARRIMAFAMAALMVVGLMPINLVAVNAADYSSTDGLSHTVGEWIDGVRTTTWDFSNVKPTSTISLKDGDTVGGIKVINKAGLKTNGDGLSIQKFNKSTSTAYDVEVNGAIAIPVDSQTTEIELTLTVGSTNSKRGVVVGNETENKTNFFKSSTTYTATFSNAALTDGYLIVTAESTGVLGGADSGESKFKSITLKETKSTGTNEGGGGVTEPSDAPKAGETYTVDFVSMAGGLTLSGNITEDGVFSIPGSATLSTRGDQHGIDITNGDKINVKVAGDAIITLSLCQFSNATSFKVTDEAGNEIGLTSGKVTTDGNTESVEYTGEATTLTIECVGAGGSYLHSIAAANLAAAGNAENFTFWFDDKVQNGSVATGEYTYGDSVLTLVGEGSTQYTKSSTVTINGVEYGAYKAGSRAATCNDMTSLPSAGAGSLTMFAPAAKGMFTVYFTSTSFLRVHDFNSNGTFNGSVDSNAGINEFSFTVLPEHVYVITVTSKTNNMFYAGYKYVANESVDIPVTVTNADATLGSSLKLSVVDAELGGNEIEYTTATTSLNLLKGHTYKLLSSDGGVKPLVNGKETFTVTGDAIEIVLNNVADETLTGNITGTDASNVTSLSFTNTINGNVYDAVITGNTYSVSIKPGDYTTSVVTTNGGKTYDRVTVKEGKVNVNEVFVEVVDPASKRTYNYTEIETLKTSGSVGVETGKTHTIASAGSVLTIPVSGNANVVVSGYYSGTFTINSEEFSFVSGGTSQIETYTKAVDGNAVIEFSSTTYLLKIEVIPVIEFKSEISVPGDYSSLNAASNAILGMQNRPEGEAGRVTINLTDDIFEQVVMAAPYVTLKGNNHTVSWYYGVGTLYYSVDPATGYYNERLARDRYSSSGASMSLWGGVFIVKGNNFIAENTTFKNTYNYELTEAEKTDIAGSTLAVNRLADGADVTAYAYKERSNAFYIDADNIEVYNCNILSSQDTLGRNSSTNLNYHAYFNNCVIGGNTDYICGEFYAVFDNCELQWKTFTNDSSNNGKVGFIVAPKTSPNVFRNCTITTDGAHGSQAVAGKFGRTWGANSNASFINVETNGYIDSVGWGEMKSGEKATAIFNEYNLTKNGAAFTTTGCTNSTLDAVVNYIDSDTVSAVDTVLGSWTPIHYPSNGEVDTSKNGLNKTEDGKWYYYENGVVNTEKTGIIENAAGQWYVENGTINFNKTGVVEDNGVEYVVKYGYMSTGFDGLVKKSDGTWAYAEAGVLTYQYTGLANNDFGWWYVKDGVIDFTYTGIGTNQTGSYRVAYGQIDFTYNGWFRADDGEWCYITGGMVDTEKNGLQKLNEKYFYLTDGKINFNYTGLAENAGTTYYVKYGYLDFSFSGEVTVDGKTYIVENGIVKN